MVPAYTALSPKTFPHSPGLVPAYLAVSPKPFPYSPGLVPAYTAAAFTKKLARLALTTSPSGALVALAFIHNLIRRHPACMVLLHRSSGKGEDPGKAAGLLPATAAAAAAPPSSAAATAAAPAAPCPPPATARPGLEAVPQMNGHHVDVEDPPRRVANGGGAHAAVAAGPPATAAATAATTTAASSTAAAAAAPAGADPYDPCEPDPAKSRAVESSLWELEALRNHYCSQVR